MRKIVNTCFMKKNFVMKIAFAAIVVFLAASCSKKEENEVDSKAEEMVSEIAEKELEAQKALEAERKESERKNAAVQDFVDSMEYRERISQLFLVNLEGNTAFSPVEFDGERAVIPGGYIFFSFNIASSPEEIIGFTTSIADYCKENSLIPPYLSIDQEGGLVNRLRGITSSVPSCRTIAAKYSADEALSLYESQARQLSLLGFHLNLAPVSEVAYDENRDFLGTRSYGDEESVEKYASIAVRAYEQNGIGTTLKHFPGNTNTDPHTGLPEIKADAETLRKTAIEPFGAVIKNAAPAAVLMSHARTAAADGDKPACFSHYWISDVLRGELSFAGLIFSDDIFMAALEKNGYPPEKAVVLAIEAGVDCIMLSEKKFSAVLSVLEKKAREDSAFEKRIAESARRVVLFKLNAGIFSFAEGEDGKLKIVVSEKKAADERISAFSAEKEKGDLCVK